MPEPTSTVFRNAIVGLTWEEPAQLLAHPDNWRIHPERQQEALAASLEEHGWIAPVYQNDRTGHLIDGHLRVQYAMRVGEDRVPVVHLDLDPDQELTALATFDTITAMAGTDQAKLGALLEQVRLRGTTRSERMAEMLEDMRERLRPPAPAGTAGAEDEAYHVPSGFEEKATASQEAGSGVSAGGMKNLIVYLTPGQYPEFLRKVLELGEAAGLDTASDALVALVDWAHANQFDAFAEGAAAP